LKYLIRPRIDYLVSGMIEWAPDLKLSMWYPISQVEIEPPDIRKQLIEKVFPKISKTKKSIAIEGFYSQERKKLVITKVITEWDETVKTGRRIAEEDEIPDEDVMFFEDLWSISEYP